MTPKPRKKNNVLSNVFDSNYMLLIKSYTVFYLWEKNQLFCFNEWQSF